MKVFVICLVLMSIYCAQGQQNFAQSWVFGRSDLSQGNQQANVYQANNGQGVASSSATSSSGGNGVVSSSQNSGYDVNGTYYEREVVERIIGNTLYHDETIYWPSLERTKVIQYTVDLTNPNAQPVWNQNY